MILFLVCFALNLVCRDVFLVYGSGFLALEMFSMRFSCSVSRACETFIWAFWSCSSKRESISIAMSEDLLTSSPSFTRYFLRIALVVASSAYCLVLGGLWCCDVECFVAVFE